MAAHRAPATGYLCLLSTATIWIGSSYITQVLVDGSSPEDLQMSPLELALICSSTFIVMLPAVWLQRWWSGKKQASRGTNSISSGDEEEDRSAPFLRHEGTQEEDEGLEDAGEAQTKSLQQRNDRHILVSAALVAPVWFAAQLTFAQSLALTSVASNTILSSSAAVFTAAASAALLGERPRPRALAGIALCMAGVAGVVLADDLPLGGSPGGSSPPPGGPPPGLGPGGAPGSGGGGLGGALGSGAWGPGADDSGHHALGRLLLRAWGRGRGATPGEAGAAGPDPSSGQGLNSGPSGQGLGLGLPAAGDLLAVASAALYGLYTVLMRMRLDGPGCEGPAATALFFGYIGAMSAGVLGAGVAAGWLLRGVAPPALGLAVGQGLLDYVAADYLWARAVLLLSPTTTTVGLSLQIPAAAAIDACLGRARWVGHPAAAALFLGGAAAVVAGFGLCQEDDGWWAERARSLIRTARRGLGLGPGGDDGDEYSGGGGRGAQGGGEVRSFAITHHGTPSGGTTPSGRASDSGAGGGAGGTGAQHQRPGRSGRTTTVVQSVCASRGASLAGGSLSGLVGSSTTLAALEGALARLRAEHSHSCGAAGGEGRGAGAGDGQGGQLPHGGYGGGSRQASQSQWLLPAGLGARVGPGPGSGPGALPVSADQEDAILAEALAAGAWAAEAEAEAAAAAAAQAGAAGTRDGARRGGGGGGGGWGGRGRRSGGAEGDGGARQVRWGLW